MTTVEMELENSPSFISLAMTALRLTSSTVSQIIKSRKTITLEEVAFHDSSSSCWLVIYDRVYDVTDFLKIVSVIVYIKPNIELINNCMNL